MIIYIIYIYILRLSKIFRTGAAIYLMASVWNISDRPMYEVLPKNSGNLNSAPEPVAVCPSAARCGLQYALWISVPTVVKLKGRVIKFSAFLWGYVLLIRRFFTTDMTEQRICIKFCFNLKKKLLQKLSECYRKPSEIMPWAKAKLFYGTNA
jgi:hypothetical protein